MTTFLLLLPTFLSALVLAAHFLRRGAMLGVLACLALLVLPRWRRPWAARVIQTALVFGGLEWAKTLMEFTEGRIATGEPWMRMAVILGSVILVALVAAVLYETPALKRHFGRTQR